MKIDMKIKFIAILLLMIIPVSVIAEDVNYTQVWVICQPDSFVNVRMNPKNSSEVVAYMLPTYELWTDDKVKNGFLHLVNLSAEVTEGWINKGFIVYEEPIKTELESYIDTETRVAARKSINGKVRKWLYNFDPIKVYYITSEWSVTDKGFVKTEFIYDLKD